MTPAIRSLVTHRTYDRPSILPPRFSRRTDIESHLHLASGLSCIKSFHFIFFHCIGGSKHVWAEFCHSICCEASTRHLKSGAGIHPTSCLSANSFFPLDTTSQVSCQHQGNVSHKRAWGDRRFVKSNDREAHDPSALHDHKVRVTEQQ
jgi:hypothetical protein